MGTKTARTISCVQTLTGTELLMTAHLSSAAEVELTCYYTVEHRGGTYLSPHSDISSVVVQKSITTPRAPAVSLTTDYTVGASKSTGSSFTTFLTSVNPASASTDMTSEFPVTSLPPTTNVVETEVTTTPTMPAFTVSTVIRITAVVTLVLLGSALLVCQSRTENCFCKRLMANISDETTEMSENIRSSEPQQAESALRDLLEAAVAQGEEQASDN
ncbi:uncharacterized protein PAE49_023304 [Odontesthes bonariensis]|uniref:uncharacterized protein LOC142377827 n=1 Tax=Odontesthes bonariensis TaxID=219752 RepID=UPI003F58F445